MRWRASFLIKLSATRGWLAAGNADPATQGIVEVGNAFVEIHVRFFGCRVPISFVGETASGGPARLQFDRYVDQEK